MIAWCVGAGAVVVVLAHGTEWTGAAFHTVLAPIAAARAVAWHVAFVHGGGGRGISPEPLFNR